MPAAYYPIKITGAVILRFFSAYTGKADFMAFKTFYLD